MLLIRRVLYYEYLTGFDLDIPPLGKYLVRQSQTNNGLLVGAFMEEQAVGIAVVEFSDFPILTYLFVEEQFRKKGIGTRLLKEVINCVKKNMHQYIRASIVLQNACGEIMDHILTKSNFEVSNTATIIRYANDEKCKKAWDNFMENRGKRIIKSVEKRGYKTMTFKETSAEVFKLIKNVIGSKFPANLDPFIFINHGNQRLVPEHSFVTLKGDEPAAFATVTTVDDKTLIFQQLSTSKECRGDGAFFLPLSSFLESFFAGGNFSKVSAVVYDGNNSMKKLVNSFIGPLSESTKTQNDYVLKIV